MFWCQLLRRLCGILLCLHHLFNLKGLSVKYPQKLFVLGLEIRRLFTDQFLLSFYDILEDLNLIILTFLGWQLCLILSQRIMICMYQWLRMIHCEGSLSIFVKVIFRKFLINMFLFLEFGL